MFYFMHLIEYKLKFYPRFCILYETQFCDYLEQSELYLNTYKFTCGLCKFIIRYKDKCGNFYKIRIKHKYVMV